MWVEIVIDILQYINAVFLGFYIGIRFLKKEKEYNDRNENGK